MTGSTGVMDSMRSGAFISGSVDHYPVSLRPRLGELVAWARPVACLHEGLHPVDAMSFLPGILDLPEIMNADGLCKDRHMRLFVSYAAADRQVLRTLEEALKTLRHEVWVDREPTCGQDWWGDILGRIRDCDAVVVAVTPALLESDLDSEAAAKERNYARQLGKPLLLVLLSPALTDRLPEDLAALQLVDYTEADAMKGLELAGALASLPAAAPLPAILPESPSRPIAYVSDIAQRAGAPNLSLEDQLALVAVLGVTLDRASEHAAAVELLETLLRRPDLYHVTWQEIDKLLQRQRGGPAAGPDSTPDAAPELSDHGGGEESLSAPGWYADPSGRHQLRWYDGDWTEYAADSGQIVEDRDFY